MRSGETPPRRRRQPATAPALLAGAFFALLVTGLATPAPAAPIRVESPGTGIFLGNVLVGRVRFEEQGGPGVTMSRRTFSVTGLYSPTTHLLLGISVPYVEKRLDLDAAGEETTRGLGDLSLVAHYRFWNRVRKGYRDMAAIRAVLEVPSGSTDRNVDLPVGKAERHALQPGSGSVDGTILLALGRAHYRYGLHLNAAYRVNGEGDDFRAGDRVSADLSAAAFLFPKRTRARGFEVSALLETGYAHMERSRLDGQALENSGGDAWFVAPGLQCIASERILFEVSLRLPVVEDLNGRQPGLDYDVIAGLRFAF